MPRDARDPMPARIKPREIIHLVTWTHTKDEGPKPVTVTGDFMGRTSTVWQVRVGGRINLYPRTVWEPCLP